MTPDSKILNEDQINNENAFLWCYFQELEEEIKTLKKNKEENEELTKKIKKLEEENKSLSKIFSDCITKVDVGSLFIKAYSKGNLLKVSECLTLIISLFGDRVEVLNEAWLSASEADNYFTQTDKLFSLLFRLLTDGYDLKQKTGDSLISVFTKDEYSSKESETTENNRYLRNQRKFIYKGKCIYTPAHLKIGVANNHALTLRIHFIYDESAKKFVISHCGNHLGLKK